MQVPWAEVGRHLYLATGTLPCETDDGLDEPPSRRNSGDSAVQVVLVNKPGWRNWQTQRTQNPPGFGPWGFDPPSRHQ